MRKNRKVKYTQMVLRECLLALLKTKPIEKITVTEICKLADINRGTFYSYFLDPFDLLSKIEANMYNEFVAILKRPADLPNEPISDYFRRMFEMYNVYKDLMRVLFGEFGDRKFLMKCVMIGHEDAISDWHTMAPNISISNLEYIYTFLSNGTMGIVERWIKNDFRESPAELATLESKFLTGSLEKYFG